MFLSSSTRLNELTVLSAFVKSPYRSFTVIKSKVTETMTQTTSNMRQIQILL